MIIEFFKSKSELTTKQEKTPEKPKIEDNDEVNTAEDSPEKPKKNSESSSKNEHAKVYLDEIFSILNSKSINFTSAGYFAKVVSNLYIKRPTSVTFTVQ